MRNFLPASLAALLALPSGAPAQEDAPRKESALPVLLFKPGNEQARAEVAGLFIGQLGAWMYKHVVGPIGAEASGAEGPVRIEITNDPAAARKLVQVHLPGREEAQRGARGLAIVPASFWYSDLRSLEPAPTVVATVPRYGQVVDTMTLVVSRESEAESLDDLEGKVVHTHRSFDADWLRDVVFPTDRDPTRFLKLRESPSLADDVFLLAEEPDDPEAPAAILVDDTTRRFFIEQDIDTWRALREVWTSEPFPRELVVAVGAWDAEAVARLRTALLAMPKTADGERLLRLMQSRGFVAPDQALLERTVEKARSRAEARRAREKEKGPRDGKSGEAGKTAGLRPSTPSVRSADPLLR